MILCNEGAGWKGSSLLAKIYDRYKIEVILQLPCWILCITVDLHLFCEKLEMPTIVFAFVESAKAGVAQSLVQPHGWLFPCDVSSKL